MSPLPRGLLHINYSDVVKQQSDSSDNVAPPQSPGEQSSIDDSSPAPVPHNHSLNSPTPSSPDHIRRSPWSSRLDRRSRTNRRQSRSINSLPPPASSPANGSHRSSSRHQRHRNRPSPPLPRREPNANSHRSESCNNRQYPSVPDQHADLDHQRLDHSSSKEPPVPSHQHPDPDHHESNPPLNDAAPSTSNRHPDLSCHQLAPHSEAISSSPKNPQSNSSNHLPTASSSYPSLSATQKAFPRDNEDTQDLDDWLSCHSELLSRVNALPVDNAANTAKYLHKYLSHCERHLHYLLRSSPFSDMETVLSSHLKKACIDIMALVSASIGTVEAQSSEQTLRCSSPSPTLCPSPQAKFVAEGLDPDVHAALTEDRPQFTTQITTKILPISDLEPRSKAVDCLQHAGVHGMRREAVQYRILKRADAEQARESYGLEVAEADSSPGSENAGIADSIHAYDSPAEGAQQCNPQASGECVPSLDPGAELVVAGTGRNTDIDELLGKEMLDFVRLETKIRSDEGVHGAEVVGVNQEKKKRSNRTSRGAIQRRRERQKVRRSLQEQCKDGSWCDEAECLGEEEEKGNEEHQETIGNTQAEKAKWNIVGYKVQVESAEGMKVGKARKAELTNAQRNWERKERTRSSRQRHREDSIQHDQVKDEQEDMRGGEESKSEEEEKKQGQQGEKEWTVVCHRVKNRPGAKRVFGQIKVAEARRAELDDGQFEALELERRARRPSRHQPQQQREPAAKHVQEEASNEEEDNGDCEETMCAGCDLCHIHGGQTQGVCNNVGNLEKEMASDETIMLGPEQHPLMRDARIGDVEQVDDSHANQTRDVGQDIALCGLDTGEVVQSLGLRGGQTDEIEQLDGSNEKEAGDDEQDIALQNPDQDPELHDAQARGIEQAEEPHENQTRDIEQDIDLQGVDGVEIDQDTSSQKVETDELVHDPGPCETQMRNVGQVDNSLGSKRRDGGQDITSQGIDRTDTTAINQDPSSQRVGAGDEEPHARETGTGMRPGNIDIEKWLRALEDEERAR